MVRRGRRRRGARRLSRARCRSARGLEDARPAPRRRSTPRCGAGCARAIPRRPSSSAAWTARCPTTRSWSATCASPATGSAASAAPPPPRKLSYPLGWGTLGCAFPQGLGAALAGRGPALSVSGDGGFLFACGELATAAQERIPLTAVVVDDGGYGMLRFDQDRRGDPHEGVDLVTPDFAGLAALLRRDGRRRWTASAPSSGRRSSAISRWTSPRCSWRGPRWARRRTRRRAGTGPPPGADNNPDGHRTPQSGRRPAAAASDIPWNEVGLRIEWLGEPERFARLAADWDRHAPRRRPAVRPSPVVLGLVPGVRRPGRMRVCLAWEGRPPRGRLPARASAAALARRHGQRAHPRVPAGRQRAREAVRAVVEAALAQGSGNVYLAGPPVRRPRRSRCCASHRRGRAAPT